MASKRRRSEDPSESPARSAGRASDPDVPSGRAASPSPDPEVSEKPTRRQYPAEYKLRILKEADTCTEPGDLGALLRREGLYSSLLSTWRRQREDVLVWDVTSGSVSRLAECGGTLLESEC